MNTSDSSAPSAPSWSTSSGGLIIGFADQVDHDDPRTVFRATGIPYANAPRGRLPQILHPGVAPIQATTPGPTCPQGPISPISRLLSPKAQPQEHSEDCLRLSITTPPDLADEEKLPVIVWIHGGGNNSGGGDLPRFAPHRMVADHRVIVVGVTFRLGFFGFLGTHDSELADDVSVTPGNSHSNLAIYDVRTALQWVAEHIADFGGDPEKITALGQSAGADLILAVLAAAGHEDSDIPFQRAILHSPPLSFIEGLFPERKAQRAEIFEHMRQCQKDNTDLVAAEIEASKATLEKYPDAGMPLGPEYGRAPLPADENVIDALTASLSKIDVVFGHTPREAGLFIWPHPKAQKARKIPLVGKSLVEKAIHKATEKTYLSAKFAEISSSARRAYQFEFDWGAADNPYRGVHTSELPLLFGKQESWEDSVLLEDTRWELVIEDGRALSQLWAQFARDGELASGATKFHYGQLDLKQR